MITENEKGFIELAISSEVLKFGQFTLKSGRVSPYFFNAGLFNSGQSLLKLGQYFAHRIVQSNVEFDMLYGPAYKGIPLATTIAIALATSYDLDVPVCFNRKEAKGHGEGGRLIGAPLQGKVLIVDDVISAGTSIRESIEMIRQQSASFAGVVIALDRQERGQQSRSASQEVTDQFGAPVYSIAGLNSLIEYVNQSEDSSISQYQSAIQAYQAEYGCELIL